jgi:hypothetical protein
MTSSIVRTNPTAGTATTSSVRDNFGFAADEINRLLRASTDKTTTANSISLTATFADVPTFTLVDGIRVLLEVAVSNTDTSPTLNVNGSGPKAIKKADGSSLAVGDLVAGGYYEFVYDSGSTEWRVLNLSIITSQDTLFESPQFTGTPTAPTATEGTNTTQLATTAFVQAATPDASESVKGIIELATDAEVKAGVDAVKALTAANLLRVAVDNTEVTASGLQQGSIEIAGVVVKWGRILSTTNSAQQFTFDEAFPNFCSVVSLTRNQAGGVSQIGVSLTNSSNFTIDRDDSFGTSQQIGCFFIAIGG